MTRLPHLREAVEDIGKPEWQPMLRYVAELHERSLHPARPPFPYPWEEIGPGYCYGPAFGHWDVIHALLDVMASEPEHARKQILNNLAAQQADGLVPGVIWMREETPHWSQTVGHPPVWPVAVEDYAEQTGSEELIKQCYEPLIRQIGWFETYRKVNPEGFYYTDILNRRWESGVDEGVRFDQAPEGSFACVDATSHVYLLCDHAARWSERLGKPGDAFRTKADQLRTFIQNELFDEEMGFFHDIWAVGNPSRRRLALEGMWPLVVGAATWQQADRAIGENLRSSERFFSDHPVATVGVEEPCFELRMWRGPTWNSMSYWAARGCLRYNRPHDARRILEEALRASADQFERTGTIWEFYHPHGGEPEELQRKPHTVYNQPCKDYLGHNPLIVMALLFERAMREEHETDEEATYTAQQATEAIRTHFPDLAIEHIRFCGEGSDFCAYAVNEEHLFRFGANRESAERLHWERHLLPRLQSNLSVPLPQFEFIGPMGNGRPMTLYRMIRGKPFHREISENLSKLSRQRVAKQLAEFLHVMHSFPMEEARSCGVWERPMEERVREFHGEAQRRLYPRLSQREWEALEGWFEEYAHTPAYSEYTPALVHGDLQSRHVLFDPELESIAGIIDFSDIWIGDADHDLYYLYEAHGEAFLEELLNWYPHHAPERLPWKFRFFDLLRYLDEIIWGMEDGHTKHVEEGWHDLKRFLEPSDR